MVDWCLQHVPVSQSPSILEIGSGNGILLTSLTENGYDSKRMQGIDYSSDAVTLARKVASAHGTSASDIRYSVCDFLNDDVPKASPEIAAYDLILDKGTFDAIALAERNPDGTAPSDSYPKRLATALSSGGYFLITCILAFSILGLQSTLRVV